jgi:hypothetical protein
VADRDDRPDRTELPERAESSLPSPPSASSDRPEADAVSICGGDGALSIPHSACPGAAVQRPVLAKPWADRLATDTQAGAGQCREARRFHPKTRRSATLKAAVRPASICR